MGRIPRIASNLFLTDPLAVQLSFGCMNRAVTPSFPILLRTVWVLLRAWGACAASYLLGIILIASVAEGLTLSVASALAVILVAAEVVVTFAAIAWARKGLTPLLQPVARWFWLVAFALVQWGTCGIAVITTLLALNR